MKRNPRRVKNSGAYSSPGTPEHGGEVPKSWSSERAIRGHVSGAALMAFNSGRALPSKWDDAERWITSPVSSHSSATAIPRRHKSKSGPLGLVYLSPQNGNFMPHSSLTTGVLLPAGFSFRCDVNTSGGVLGLLSGTSSRDEILDGTKEEAPVSDGVEQSVTTKKLIDKGHCPSSFSALPSASIDEVRDVQVDKGMTMAGHGQSEKQGVREMKDSSHVQDIPLPWNASEDSKDTSKMQRGEAKITAWENLQKAKAEAAIRKLEMNLEKKKSASMDRIMNKLRASEMKAQAMRNLLSENDPTQVRTTSSHGGISFCKYVKLHLHSNCFLCHRN